MVLDALKRACLSCQGCRLCATRTNVVFGTGAIDAEVMLIGEAPGKSEDEQGMPFVGRSGKLLDEMLATAGLSRYTNVYIANIVKCRPPDNRNPFADEWSACTPFLHEQIKLIAPKIIICLGRISAQRIISPDFSVMKSHGQWTLIDDIWCTATLHPAAILRNIHNKPLSIDDFAQVRKKLDTCH